MNNLEIMLAAIKTQVCGGESVIFGELSVEQLESLYVFSKLQDMAHIVATELDRQGLLGADDEICNKFRKQQLIAFMRYERINYEVEAVCKAFEEKKIPHMPMKGSVIRRYYKEPWMRTSSDIDILIHEEDLEEAKSVLCGTLGYREEAQGTHYDLSFYSLSGVHIELHYKSMAHDRAVNSHNILERIWEYSAPEDGWSYRYANSDEMFYFYHVAHMVKHFEHKGCGVRFFLDMWILCHQREYDKDKRNELLEEGKLLKFADAAEKLSDVWFSEGIHSELTHSMESYVLSGSIYGSHDTMMVTEQIKKGGKAGYAISRIFLPYEQMVLQFPKLKSKKYLLPFYHIRRWCRIIFRGGIKRSASELKKNVRLSGAKVDNVQKMFYELGL